MLNHVWVQTPETHFNLHKSWRKIMEQKLIEDGTIFFIQKGSNFIFSFNGKTKIWEIKADQLPLYNIENIYKLSVEYFWLSV